MRGPKAHRLATWLALVAVLFLGVAPNHALVLCFEPDGTMALESAGRGRPCDGCADSPGERDAPRVVSTLPACCDCLDLPVEGAGHQARVRTTSVELTIQLPPALAPASLPLPLPPVVELARLLGKESPPGPPGVLEHIRSVVLRV